jgi:hypothetical protein
MPKKKMSKEEMKKAVRIAASHAKSAKKKAAPKKKEKKSWVSKLKGKVKKHFETARTKGTKAELKKAGTKFKTDAEREAEKRRKKKK